MPFIDGMVDSIMANPLPTNAPGYSPGKGIDLPRQWTHLDPDMPIITLVDTGDVSAKSWKTRECFYVAIPGNWSLFQGNCTLPTKTSWGKMELGYLDQQNEFVTRSLCIDGCDVLVYTTTIPLESKFIGNIWSKHRRNCGFMNVFCYDSVHIARLDKVSLKIMTALVSESTYKDGHMAKTIP